MVLQRLGYYTVISLTLINFVFCAYAQEEKLEELEFYQTYDQYAQGMSTIGQGNIKIKQGKEMTFAKLSHTSIGEEAIFGFRYYDHTWIKHGTNKYYKVKEDPIGKYYEVKGEEYTPSELATMVAFGLAGYVVTKDKSQNIIFRFREDPATKTFTLSEYPNLPESHAYVYFSKYAKKDQNLEINLESKLYDLPKGSYVKLTFPAKPIKKYTGTYISDGKNEPFTYEIKPATDLVFLIEQNKKGQIKLSEMNETMAAEFISNIDKYERIE